MKISAEQMYKNRLTQIETDLHQEYRKGKRKNKNKIAKLLDEQSRLKRLVSS